VVIGHLPAALKLVNFFARAYQPTGVAGQFIEQTKGAVLKAATEMAATAVGAMSIADPVAGVSTLSTGAGSKADSP
jgi:hypothetical protein